MNRSDLRGWLKGTKVSTAARVVYLALALHADPSERAWPSLTTLAVETGSSVSTAQRALRELEAFGEVSRQRRPGLPDIYALIPNPSHIDRPTPVNPTGPVRSNTRTSPVKYDPNPGQSDREKELKDYKKERSGAAPQNGAAARTAAPSPVLTRDDGATFLPGTGWVHEP